MRIALCTHDSMKLLLTVFVFSSPNFYALFFEKFQFFVECIWFYVITENQRATKGKRKL